MPILRIESSIPLPPKSSRADALARFAECTVRCLDVRPDQVRPAAIATFIEELSVQIAAFYAVDVQAVRVLVQEYPSTHWGIGGAPARA